MGRAPCCSKVGLKRGPWTSEEDSLLTKYVEEHGEGNWRNLPKAAGLWRCGKSCRLRWINYLRPDLKRGNISEDEEELIIKLHTLLGNRWSLIAGRIPGRTDNEIKNYWNTHLKKKLANNAKEISAKKQLSHPGTFQAAAPGISAGSHRDNQYSSPKCCSHEKKLPELQTDVSHGNTCADSDVSSQGKKFHIEQAPTTAPHLLSRQRAPSLEVSALLTNAASSIKSRSKILLDNADNSFTSQSFSAVSPSSSVSDSRHHAAPLFSYNNLAHHSDPYSLKASAAPSSSGRLADACSEHDLMINGSGASNSPTAMIRSSFEGASPEKSMSLSVSFCSSDDNNNDNAENGSSGRRKMEMSFDYSAAEINYNILTDFFPAANYELSSVEHLQNLDFLQDEAEMEINDNFWGSMNWLVTADSWELF